MHSDEVHHEIEEITYTLDEMTPDMVHYGSVPESVLVEEVDNVRRIVDSEFAGSNDAEMLRNLTKVCNNGVYYMPYIKYHSISILSFISIASLFVNSHEAVQAIPPRGE